MSYIDCVCYVVSCDCVTVSKAGLCLCIAYCESFFNYIIYTSLNIVTCLLTTVQQVPVVVKCVHFMGNCR
jgi:hypothetical protein